MEGKASRLELGVEDFLELEELCLDEAHEAGKAAQKAFGEGEAFGAAQWRERQKWMRRMADGLREMAVDRIRLRPASKVPALAGDERCGE